MWATPALPFSARTIAGWLAPSRGIPLLDDWLKESRSSLQKIAWPCAAFTPDGTVIALATAENTHLFAAGTDHELAALPAGRLVTQVCFSPDGTQLLMIYEPGATLPSPPSVMTKTSSFVASPS